MLGQLFWMLQPRTALDTSGTPLQPRGGSDFPLCPWCVQRAGADPCATMSQTCLLPSPRSWAVTGMRELIRRQQRGSCLGEHIEVAG